MDNPSFSFIRCAKQLHFRKNDLSAVGEFEAEPAPESAVQPGHPAVGNLLPPAITVRTCPTGMMYMNMMSSGMNDQGSLWQLTRPPIRVAVVLCTSACEAHQHTRGRSQGWVLDASRLALVYIICIHIYI